MVNNWHTFRPNLAETTLERRILPAVLQLAIFPNLPSTNSPGGGGPGGNVSFIPVNYSLNASRNRSTEVGTSPLPPGSDPYYSLYQAHRKRLGAQRGPAVAAIVVARKQAEAAWYMLTRRQAYRPQGAARGLAA